MDKKKEADKFDYIFDKCRIVGLGDMPTLRMQFIKIDGNIMFSKVIESIIYYN